MADPPVTSDTPPTDTQTQSATAPDTVTPEQQQQTAQGLLKQPTLPDTTASTAAALQQLGPVPTAPQVPKPPEKITVVRRGGLAGIVDEIRNALSGGTTTHELKTDAQGNKYVAEVPLSHGQQWARIAAQAAQGAAAGYAAGKGPAGAGRAGLAGFETAFQQQDRQRQQYKEMTEEARQDLQDKFNTYKTRLDMVSTQMELSRKGAQATEDTIKHWNDEYDQQRKLGNVELGTYANPKALASSNILQLDPQFWQHSRDGQIIPVARFSPDGKYQGSALFLQTAGGENQMAPKGSKYVSIQPGEGDEPAKLVYSDPAGPISLKQLHDVNDPIMKEWGELEKAKKDSIDKESAVKDLNTYMDIKTRQTLAQQGKGPKPSDKENAWADSYEKAETLKQQKAADLRVVTPGAQRTEMENEYQRIEIKKASGQPLTDAEKAIETGMQAVQANMAGARAQGTQDVKTATTTAQLQTDVNFATNYLAKGKLPPEDKNYEAYNATSDYALVNKFIDATRPSGGRGVSPNLMKLYLKAKSLQGALEVAGGMVTDERPVLSTAQREQMVHTIKDVQAATVKPGQTAPSTSGNTQPNTQQGNHPFFSGLGGHSD